MTTVPHHPERAGLRPGGASTRATSHFRRISSLIAVTTALFAGAACESSSEGEDWGPGGGSGGTGGAASSAYDEEVVAALGDLVRAGEVAHRGAVTLALKTTDGATTDLRTEPLSDACSSPSRSRRRSTIPATRTRSVRSGSRCAARSRRPRCSSAATPRSSSSPASRARLAMPGGASSPRTPATRERRRSSTSRSTPSRRRPGRPCSRSIWSQTRSGWRRRTRIGARAVAKSASPSPPCRPPSPRSPG